MMQRIRDTVRDLFTSGGWRRHPLACLLIAAVILFIVLGLMARPL